MRKKIDLDRAIKDFLISDAYATMLICGLFLLLIFFGSVSIISIVSNDTVRKQSLPVSPLSAPTITPTAWLINGNFDGGYHFQDGIGEIYIADGWVAWYLEMPQPCIPNTPGCYVPCPLNCGDCDPDHIDYGCYWCRPEYRDTTDIHRCRSGKAQKYFSFGRMHEAGLYQQVYSVPVGSLVQFSIYAQAWQCRNYEQCCKAWKACTSDYPYAMNLRVGIDPTGGISPIAPSVIWSAPVESFDKWTQLFVSAVAQTSTVTVFTRSFAEFDWARINNDVYLDDARLSVAENPSFVYLPIVSGGKITHTMPPGRIDLARAAMFFVPPSITLNVSQTQTVYLVVESTAAAEVGEVMLYYDPAIVEVARVIRGGFLPDGASEITYGAGAIHAEVYGNQLAGTKNGMLMAVVIKGVSPGVTVVWPVSRAACFIGIAGGGGINPMCDGAIVEVR